MRIVGFVVAACLWVGVAVAVEPTTPENTGQAPGFAQACQCPMGQARAHLAGQTAPQSYGQVQVAQACCKVCRKGKACGNSCIARWKTCRKPPGCACNAN